jgi:3-dehydroquinate dehydratase-1
MKNLFIGTVSLGKIPRVVAVLDKYYSLKKILQLKKMGVHILEIRVDKIGTNVCAICDYIDNIRLKTNLPVICTIRETKDNANKRLTMFKEIIPHVNAIDIEIDAKINPKVIEMAHNKKRVVIVSEHDFNKTPDYKGLKNIAEKALKQGADIIKIATMAKSLNDVKRLMNFTCSWGNNNIVAISMGEVGKITRVAGFAFGSLFTYGYIGKTVAPGQLSVEQLIKEIKVFYSKIEK